MVEADKVRKPGIVIHIFKKRRIRSQLHHILIAFHADQEGSFSQSSVQLAYPAPDYCQLSQKNFRVLPVVIIIIIGIFRKEFRSAVKMLIHDIRLQAFFLQMGIGYQPDMGIPFSYGIIEFPVAYFIYLP